jgi:hypothetical protein
MIGSEGTKAEEIISRRREVLILNFFRVGTVWTVLVAYFCESDLIG